MKNAIRWLPAFAGTFALGAYVGSPTSAQATGKDQLYVAVVVLVLVLLATGLLCAVTRGKTQEQNTGFGRLARNRNGR